MLTLHYSSKVCGSFF